MDTQDSDTKGPPPRKASCDDCGWKGWYSELKYDRAKDDLLCPKCGSANCGED